MVKPLVKLPGGGSLEWNDDKVIKITEEIVKQVSKEGAVKIRGDIRRKLSSMAKRGQAGLLGTIKAKKSRFKDGGYMVGVFDDKGGKWEESFGAQALFVEFGHAKPDDPRGPKVTPAHPFFRPAINKNKRWIKSRFKKALK